jgi:hypothetical protein
MRRYNREWVNPRGVLFDTEMAYTLFSMLPEMLTAVLAFLSFAVWFGVIFGGLAGLLTGAVVRTLRTRQVTGLFAGPILAAVPSAGISVAVSMVISVLAILFGRAGKGGWDMPLWADDAYAVIVFAAGVAGAFWGLKTRAGSGRFRATVWITVGGLLGALASMPFGFQGYYFLQSNVEPIEAATVGVVVGAGVVAGWLALARLIIYVQD